MLRFTTTEPGFMGFSGSEPFVEPQEDWEVKMEESDPPCNWQWYIHGEAEDLAGYDIPKVLDGFVSSKSGEYAAELLLQGNAVHRCVLVQWCAGEEKVRYLDERGTCDRRLMKGLICLETDTKSLEYARKKAKEGAQFL